MLNPFEKLYKFCPNCKTRLIKKSIFKKTRIVCPNCNFIFWNNPRPSFSALIIDKKKNILLLKRADKPLKDYWCLPGGVMEYDESPERSIIREVKEETNLDFKIEKLTGVYLIDNDPRGNVVDVIYMSQTINSPVKLSNEHSQYKFFPPNNLPELIAYKHREAIADYLKKDQ